MNSDLRIRVEKAAKLLNYQVDRAASQLRSGQARVVGVLVPDLDDVFFTSLVSRLEVMARKDGYDVIVTSSRDDVELEKSRLRALLGWRPAGLVAIPCSDTIPELLREESGSIPLVFADRVVLSGAFADTVTIDNVDAGELVGDYLRRCGHLDVVIAASDLSIAPIRDRIKGVRNVFVRDGLEPTVVEIGSNAERGAELFANWLGANAVPSAIFGLTNVTTLSVLSALARHRIDVPEHSALVGFDDYAWMSARKVPLTAVRQPIDAMAQSIWERLRSRMAGNAEESQHTVLNVSLQVRDSVRKVSITPPEIQPAYDIRRKKAADNTSEIKFPE